jgi:hypothetical protein
MSVISELHNSLHTMGLEQHVLAFAFLTSYTLALGRWFGPRGRQRAALAAFAAAIGFAAMTTPWIDGAMLMTLAVAGLGVFIAAAWLLSHMLAPRGIDDLPAIAAAVQPETAAVRGPAVKAASSRPSAHTA